MKLAENSPPVDRVKLKRRVTIHFVQAIFVLAGIFFIPAGTWRYWQAWVYMIILLVPMGFMLGYFFRKDPELLERRMRTREKERQQRVILWLSLPVFLAAFLLPGLDRRLGWSAVPLWLVVAADAVVLAAYGLFVRVMIENRYLSRVVEVTDGQKLIDTGPYAVVRHPMYAAVIPLYGFSPLALGSFWALIPAALLIPFIIARIFNEEKVLGRELAGYLEYTRRVRFRLIPGIW